MNDIKWDLHLENGRQELCGKVYRTVEGIIILNCTLCDTNYQGFGLFSKHLYDYHTENNIPKGVKTEAESDLDDFEDICSIQMSDLSSDALEDVEISVPNITQDSKVKVAITAPKSTVQTVQMPNLSSNALADIEMSVSKITQDSKDSVMLETSAVTESIDKTAKSSNMESLEATNEKISEILERIMNRRPDTPPVAVTRSVRKKTIYINPESSEELKYTCTICGARLKSQSTLYSHFHRHTTEKTHQCPKCPKMFYSPKDVTKHMYVHTGYRPFLCALCGLTYTTNMKLKDHMRRHTNVKAYKCPTCGKSFYNASLLAKHLVVHTNERPYKCSLCDAKFAFNKGLSNHLKLHENKREYKCELCEAAFNQQAGLFSHMKNRHTSV